MLQDLFRQSLAAMFKAITGGKAVEEFSKLVRVMPDGTIYMEYASQLLAAGRWKEAEEALETAIRAPSLAKTAPRALYELIVLQYRRFSRTVGPIDPRQEAKIIANLRRLATLGPLPAKALDYTSYVAMQMGEYGLALSLVEEWERLAPKDLELLRNRALIEYNLGAFPRALLTAKQILKRVPKDAVGLRIRDSALQSIKNMQAAANSMAR